MLLLRVLLSPAVCCSVLKKSRPTWCVYLKCWTSRLHRSRSWSRGTTTCWSALEWPVAASASCTAAAIWASRVRTVTVPSASSFAPTTTMRLYCSTWHSHTRAMSAMRQVNELLVHSSSRRHTVATARRACPNAGPQRGRKESGSTCPRKTPYLRLSHALRDGARRRVDVYIKACSLEVLGNCICVRRKRLTNLWLPRDTRIIALPRM